VYNIYSTRYRLVSKKYNTYRNTDTANILVTSLQNNSSADSISTTYIQIDCLSRSIDDCYVISRI